MEDIAGTLHLAHFHSFRHSQIRTVHRTVRHSQEGPVGHHYIHRDRIHTDLMEDGTESARRNLPVLDLGKAAAAHHTGDIADCRMPLGFHGVRLDGQNLLVFQVHKRERLGLWDSFRVQRRTGGELGQVDFDVSFGLVDDVDCSC